MRDQELEQVHEIKDALEQRIDLLVGEALSSLNQEQFDLLIMLLNESYHFGDR